MSLHREWREVALSSRRNPFLATRREAVGDAGPSQRIAFFTATTWRPIQPFLEGELLLEGVRAEFTAVEYEAMAGELARGEERYDTIVLALDDDATPSPRPSDVERSTERLRLAVDALRRRTDQLIVMAPPPAPCGPHGRPHALSAPTLEGKPGVEWLDWSEAFPPGDGIDAFDARRYALGRIRYSEAGFRRLAARIAPRILRRLGIGLKAVIVDLDHTLWGGVVGDVGPDGIEVGDEYPGSAHRALQAELSAWKDAGILLAIASKNDAETALAAMDGHSQMLLRSSDFQSHQIHWEPKSVSVERILKTFNIGADAVLFIDDNPREREEVAQRFPTLRILDFPDDPLELASTLRAIPWPLLVGGSEEDQRRAELQAQQAARQEALAGTNAGEATPGDRTDYLASLGITLDIRVDDPKDLARAAQLHQKTNQFNLNPERLTEARIREIAAGHDSHVITAGYRDRFGDAGTIGAATVITTNGETTVETFLLSCRVVGLGVERALLAFIAREFGPASLRYRATEKNHVARNALTPPLEFPGETGAVPIDRDTFECPEWIEPIHASETTETTHA